MKIQPITKYNFKGKEYNSLKEVQDEVHNTIGVEVLDKISKTCPLAKHRDYIKLLELLCSKEVREVLTECLNVTFDEDIDYYNNNLINGDTKEVNILDMKFKK